MREKSLIRLIGIDVDGTLVGSAGRVHPDVWSAAERARSSGIRLALCSGRPAFGLALEYSRRLDHEGWHIFQNGASVLDLERQQSRSVTLPAEDVRGFIAEARRSARLLELYSDNAYVSESASQWARDHADLLGVPFEFHTFESLRDPVVRAQWLLPHADAQRWAATPRPHLEVALSSSPLMPETTFVGITRAGVNKGSALRAIAQEYGFDLADVMYVGDSDNDLPALETVGHPVAMANATQSVLRIARLTVGHVDQGGLAEALERAAASAQS
jgi:Cof subfamily protein (haloacid dehalogenase superfamily)